MDSEPVEVSTQQFEVEMRKFALGWCFSPEVRVMPNLAQKVNEELAYNWNVTFHKHLPYNHLWSYVKPTDWWQAVKQRWAPAWFTKRYPIKYDTIELAEILHMAVDPHSSHYTMMRNGKHVYDKKVYEQWGHCLACNMPSIMLDHDRWRHDGQRGRPHRTRHL